MANKYIIHGATYNGDGTSSAEATSNGGVGAWNTITYFEGTTPAYGTLAAGDTVYIRSKDASGADITRTLSANLNIGSAVATSTLWVTSVLDNGAIWPGIDGVLTYNCPSSYGVVNRTYNRVISLTTDALRIVDTNTAGNKTIYSASVASELCGALIDTSRSTNSYGDKISLSPDDSNHRLTRCHFKLGNYYDSFVTFNGSVGAWLIDCVYELTVLHTNGGVVVSPSYTGSCTIIGGKVIGAGATTGAKFIKTGSYAGDVRILGTDIPKTVEVAGISGAVSGTRVEAVGIDDGLGGAIATISGSADSRADNALPTLSAFLPNSQNTPWSWKVYPSNASLLYPFTLTFAKLYTGDSAKADIALEMLVADTITAANRDSVSVTVSYVDAATSSRQSLSSRDYLAEGLSSSSAGWSATSYGPVIFTKAKISLQTPSSIKTDTLIIVTLSIEFKAASANDLMVVCPDFSVTPT